MRNISRFFSFSSGVWWLSLTVLVATAGCKSTQPLGPSAKAIEIKDQHR